LGRGIVERFGMPSTTIASYFKQFTMVAARALRGSIVAMGRK
jgi:hypothetical protein